MTSVKLWEARECISILSWKLICWFQLLARHVTFCCKDIGKGKNSSTLLANGKSVMSKVKEQHRIQEENAGNSVDDEEVDLRAEEPAMFKDVGSLFPKETNVDRSLELQSSVYLCSIDISTLESPISMSRTPDGNMEWKLNTASNLETPVQLMLEEPLSPRSSSSAAQLKEDEAGDGKEKFVCHYCDAEFRIRGYLTRHIKKHAVEKAYHCPYFNCNAPPETRCHTSGGFSRRDTYKTHLRSRHFIYPEGIKTQDRNKSSGHCAHCGKWFENTSKWIEKHIESGYCTGLPEGTILPAKSARKAGKLKMIKTSTGHSRFITTQESVVEPKVLLNKEAIEAMQIVVNETNSSGQPALTKLSDNRIMLNSSNFKGEARAKKGIRRQRRRRFHLGSNSMTPFYSDASETPVIPVSSANDSVTSNMLAPHVYQQVPTMNGSVPRSYLLSTPDEAPLDEICLSLNPSPADDAGLEPVRSASSLSSDECNQSANNDMAKLFYPVVSSNTTSLNDSYCMPLDVEQISFTMPMEDLPPSSAASSSSSSFPLNKYGAEPRINVTLNNQMDPVKLSERHLRETQQYLNFYNYNFDTNL